LEMDMFKKMMLASVAAIALPAAASAADMPMKAYAPAAAVYNWTGFYVGGSAGVALHQSSTDYTAANAWDTDYSNPLINSSKIGGLVGGTVGFNYQIHNFVIGAEGDISYVGGVGGTKVGGWPDCFAGDCLATAHTDIQGLATLRARAGIDFSGTLIYGTAGIGWMKLHDNFNVLGADAKGGNFSSSKWAPAFVVGGGVEQKLTQNWSVKGEVLWAKAETTTAAPTDLSYFDTTTPPVNYDHSLTIGRIGLNYKFN